MRLRKEMQREKVKEVAKGDAKGYARLQKGMLRDI